MDFFGWRSYVSVAERRRTALREVQNRKKNGQNLSPVTIDGRTIATTFWGKSWCENLERYSDFANRLPRGRSYVRNGSVIDLQINPGVVEALVSGSDVYRVTLRIAPVSKPRWKSICQDCSGAIDSLVELLQGRFSKPVMERICRQSQGLFPSPAEIDLSCSCPDWAAMCKHVAAVLYGVGARFDSRPELLFRLREVDENELIVNAGQGIPLAKQAPAAGKVLAGEDLADIFGLDMAQASEPATEPEAPPKKQNRARPAAKAPAAAPVKKAAAKTAKAAVKKAAVTKKPLRKAAARAAKRNPARAKSSGAPAAKAPVKKQGRGAR